MRQEIIIIAALGARTRALGKEGRLLWHIPEDLTRFRRLTQGHPVIMGSRTWDSLPASVRPLPHRTNIVLTRDPRAFRKRNAHIPQRTREKVGGEDVVLARSVEEALARAHDAPGGAHTYIIGGGEVYARFLPRAHRLELTLVEEPEEGADADVFFPPYAHLFPRVTRKEVRTEGALRYTFLTLVRDAR